MEAAISSSLAHPNIVVTYTYSIKPVTDDSLKDAYQNKMMIVQFADTATHHSRGSFVNQDHAATNVVAPTNIHSYEVRLVIEYCDKGCLRSALDSGSFLMNNGLNYAAVLDTARDIASAMAHIHESGILHSDLKALNIMLKSDGSDPRGFVAKVADFGLALKMNRDETHASGLFQGTLSHMAPEVMTEGRVSKSADVYAYGILLWEIFTASRPWQDINWAHLGHAISVERRRPLFPAFTPPDLKLLAERCWSHAPDQRPTFDEVHQELVQMRKALNMTTPAVSLVSASSSSSAKKDLKLPVIKSVALRGEQELRMAPEMRQTIDHPVDPVGSLTAQIEALHAVAINVLSDEEPPSRPISAPLSPRGTTPSNVGRNSPTLSKGGTRMPRVPLWWARLQLIHQS